MQNPEFWGWFGGPQPEDASIVLPETPEHIERQIKPAFRDAFGDVADGIDLVGRDVAQEQQGQVQVFCGDKTPVCLIQILLQLAQLCAHALIGQQCKKQSPR